MLKYPDIAEIVLVDLDPAVIALARKNAGIRALNGELELTAVSIHAYSFLLDKYALLPSGCSMGDKYGPMVVARRRMTPRELPGLKIAVPGTLTTAFLTLKLLFESLHATNRLVYDVVPFDQIIPAVVAGKYDAGLIIHEGQLTYAVSGLEPVLDLGQWWKQETGLPVPLGGLAVRRALEPDVIRMVFDVVGASIRYALDHRDEALDYALEFGRGVPRELGDRFVGMYVNQWTLDAGGEGLHSIQLLLDRARAAALIPTAVVVELVPQ